MFLLYFLRGNNLLISQAVCKCRCIHGMCGKGSGFVFVVLFFFLFTCICKSSFKNGMLICSVHSKCDSHDLCPIDHLLMMNWLIFYPVILFGSPVHVIK